MNKLYPEKAFVFIPFEQELVRIDRMGRMYRHGLQSQMAERDAFWMAYTETHPEHAPYVRMGADEFYEKVRDQFVKLAGRDVGDVIYGILRPFATELSRHSFERVCLEPGPLLLTATERPTVPALLQVEVDDADGDLMEESGTPDLVLPDVDEQNAPAGVWAKKTSIAYRKYFDCRRRLAVALQYLSIELVDSDAASSKDLLTVDELSFARLFDPARDQAIWVFASLAHRKNNRVGSVLRLNTEAKAARATARRYTAANGRSYAERFLCRIAIVHGKTFYVWADSRWKEKRSTLFKLERGRQLTDRRGWKYVVVAVKNGDHLRAGTIEDALEFAQWSKERLWQHPLSTVIDDVSLNPNSHPDYHDTKVVGRIESYHEGRLVSAQCEQLVLGLADHINTVVSSDGVNHEFYRGGQVVDYICPKWFPYSVYRVDWPSFPKRGDPEVRSPRKLEVKERLVRWWVSQIVNALDA